MIKIAIAGIKGRMGSSIYQCLPEYKNMQLSNATTISKDSDIGSLVSDIVPSSMRNPSNDVSITEVLTDGFDILVDFTSINSTFSNLEFCKANNKAIVIGTTGFSEAELDKIRDYANFIPVFMSANMSLGVNIMQQLVSIAAKALHTKADIEVMEVHHNNKVDAPSGTAMMIGKTIAKALDIDLSEKGVFSREGITGEREQGTIGFSTIRGGDVVGEHTAYYYMAGERVEISHRATDRKIFARGALFAAEFLSKKQNGLYDMADALGLKL